MGPQRRFLAVATLLVSAQALPASAQGPYDFDAGRAFLRDNCDTCHQGDSPAGGLRTDNLNGIESFADRPDAWASISSRVSNGEMPPAGAPKPSLDDRERFIDWVASTWRDQACAAYLAPPPAQFRRLNQDEYSATVRDLFDIQVDVSELLPADGPGGEGFDNAAETLFVSPLLIEKYVEAAKFVVDVASKEFKSRRRVLVSRPGDGNSEPEAARRILQRFLPRAFRRPVADEEVRSYHALFRRAKRNGLDFEPAIFFVLESALVSPSFVFHVPFLPEDPRLRQYALASRFSYFLWGTMPDELLFDIAEDGRMDDPEVLARLVPRMLRDDRALEFATRFTEQWLRTRELEGAGGPDPDLFPEYSGSAELRGDILLQPVFFFREVFREDRSLLAFLDSDGTILTRNLIEHLDLPIKKEQDAKNPNWMQLPDDIDRGGLLSMPAVAAVTSHAHRTSPVLRGVWVLDSILGTPPPPPPPDVPDLEEAPQEKQTKTIRQLLASHSASPSCASCHDRIDPLGFALERYDVLGRWRLSQAGSPIDSAGRLPNGSTFEGPGGLKRVLLERKQLFVRNLARRMLGYALGRGLAPADACAVEKIVERVELQDYSAWSLAREVVASEPFRQPGRH